MHICKYLSAENKCTKCIYIQSIYIVNELFFANFRFYPMGILWVCYGYPMVRVADCLLNGSYKDAMSMRTDSIQFQNHGIYTKYI